MTGGSARWAQAPERLIYDGELTGAALRVYLFLDLRAGRRGWYWSTQPEIAEALGLGERAVRRAIVQLRDRELIATTRKGREGGAILYEIVHRRTAVQLAQPDVQNGTKWPDRSPVDRNEMAGPIGADRNEMAGPIAGAPLMGSTDPDRTTEETRAQARAGSAWKPGQPVRSSEDLAELAAWRAALAEATP